MDMINVVENVDHMTDIDSTVFAVCWYASYVSTRQYLLSLFAAAVMMLVHSFMHCVYVE